MRSAFDVNAPVSAFIGPLGPSRQGFAAWREGRFTLITSEHIITQTAAKLRLPRIGGRYNIGPDRIRSLILLLRTGATVVPLLFRTIPPITGDPDDDAVLATTRLGEA